MMDDDRSETELSRPPDCAASAPVPPGGCAVVASACAAKAQRAQVPNEFASIGSIGHPIDQR